MLDQIAVHLRTQQMLSQNYHNTVSRIVFLQDHEILGEIYEKHAAEYDSVIERIIGLGMSIDLTGVQVAAVEKLKSIPQNTKDNTEKLSQVLQMEKQLVQLIETCCKSGKYTQGTVQLLGDIANSSEGLIYKLSQRVKK